MSQFQDLVGEMLDFWYPGETVYKNYRPPWLFGMELDFYFPELKFAIEVNGSQHYLFVPSMQSEPEKHTSQRQRDKRKRQIMFARGEHIIVIRSFSGIYAHMREIFPERTFPVVPKDLQTRIKEYRQRAHKARKSSVAFKVKGKKLIGINKASTRALK
jgi:hypothetical protein